LLRRFEDVMGITILRFPEGRIDNDVSDDELEASATGLLVSGGSAGGWITSTV
jgi:hypothetical protein